MLSLRTVLCSPFLSSTIIVLLIHCIIKKKKKWFLKPEKHTKYKSWLQYLLGERKSGRFLMSPSPSHLVRRAVLRLSHWPAAAPDCRPPRSQFWASANVFFCVSFFLPLFILAALPTASHLDCVFLNIFLKWNTGLCIYLCSISSYWFQPNIPAGWDLLFPFVFKIQNKIWGKPKRKEKTQP